MWIFDTLAALTNTTHQCGFLGCFFSRPPLAFCDVNLTDMPPSPTPALQGSYSVTRGGDGLRRLHVLVRYAARCQEPLRRGRDRCGEGQEIICIYLCAKICKSDQHKGLPRHPPPNPSTFIFRCDPVPKPGGETRTRGRTEGC